MKNVISKMNGKYLKEVKLSNEEIISLLNEDKIVLVDVRYPFETKHWGFNCTLNIPMNELPDNLDKLPKDKTIVTICPENTRGNIACMYLLSEGYDVKFADEGLIELAIRLRGGRAKDLKI
jgi:rhodanese-related sulfurtransferase